MKKLITMTILLGSMSAFAGGGSVFTSEGRYFSIAVPKGWTQMPEGGRPASEKKIYGVDLLAAASGGPAPSITVKYYAKGNALFKTAQLYIEMNSRPLGTPEEGEKYSDVMGARVAGRKAYRFERKFIDFGKPRAVPPVKTVMFERHLVVPASGGFYLLMFSAPFSGAKAIVPQFDAVVKSFKPRLK